MANCFQPFGRFFRAIIWASRNYALSSHQQLLCGEGILKDEERLRGHHVVPLGPRWTGLIIDDFFAIGAESTRTEKADSFAFLALARAREAYRLHDLAGSPEKDVEAEDHFKAAGAEVDLRDSTVRLGLCLVGAPLSKRIALSTLSLRTARMPSITPKLAARLSGNWVSVLLYRRCGSAVVDELFALGAGLEKETTPCLVPLSRKASEELVMLAVLSPFFAANVAATQACKIRLSDASIQK